MFDTEDHHVLLTCLGDWQKWVSHPELRRSTPISQISRRFWWVVSFQPWNFYLCDATRIVLPLVSFNTKLYEKSWDSRFLQWEQKLSDYLFYFIPANTQGLEKNKRDAFKNKKNPSPSLEWMKERWGMVWKRQKTLRTKNCCEVWWGTCVSQLRLCYRGTLYQEGGYSLDARLRSGQN